MFSPDQISELIEIIQFNHVLYGAEVIGTSVLSSSDIKLLSEHGIDPAELISSGLTEYEQAFHFGRLASALGNIQTKSISYNDFRKFVQAGGHRPMTDHESAILESLKSQSFQAVKGLGNRIAGEMTQIVGNTEAARRAEYEEILREELSAGIINKRSVGEITRELGRRTQDWNRDLGRLVETEMHNAYEEGRASELAEKYGADVLVYKDVYAGACRHCIRLYLTGGIGSEPRKFKLSALRANGTNVGKKPADWKPTLGAVHPFCRCTLNVLPVGYDWDTERRDFVNVGNYKPKRDFTVTITIGDQKYTY